MEVTLAVMLTLILAANLIKGATAILTVLPFNSAVMAGSEVILQCGTNTSKNLTWRQRLLNATEKDGSLGVISSGTRLSNKTAQKYNIIRKSDGQFDLRFDATLGHGNEYTCKEPGGDNFSAQVIVLASEPKCYVNGLPVISNQLIVDDVEHVELRCNVTFAGRWIPSLEWIQQIIPKNEFIDYNETIIVNQEETETRDQISITSTTLGFNTTQNVTSFICTIRFLEQNRPKTTSAENIPDWSYNWTSPTFVLKSFYNSYYKKNESGPKIDERGMNGTLALIMAGLVVSAVLCIVVIVTFNLNRFKAQQSVNNNPVMSAANNPASPGIRYPAHQIMLSPANPAPTHSLVDTEPELLVQYSEVKNKPGDLPSNNQGCEHLQPVIYSEVYNSGTAQTGLASSQHLSAQCENSCKITGEDGTEYSLLPVFETKQSLNQMKARKDLFETSIYAPIDHSTVQLPAPPTSYRW